MAKESGLGWTTASLDTSADVAKDIKNDITSIDFATPRAVQDVTGLDKSAVERLLLLADYTGTINAVFNDAADQMFDVFKTVPSTSVARTLSLTVSGQSLNNEVVLTDFPLARAATGELTSAVPFALADGAVPTWS